MSGLDSASGASDIDDALFLLFIHHIFLDSNWTMKTHTGKIIVLEN